MKNLHYDLVKLLLSASDTEWRISKHYLEDSEECEGCREVLEKIKNDAAEHARLLTDEIEKHGKME